MKKKSENIVLVNKGFSLYCQGESLLAISKSLQVNRHTVERWERVYTWANNRDSIVAKVRVQTDKLVEECAIKTLDELDEIDTKLKAFMQSKEPESYSVALRGRLKILELNAELCRSYDYHNAIWQEVSEQVMKHFFLHPVIEQALKDNSITYEDVMQWVGNLMELKEIKKKTKEKYPVDSRRQ